MGDPPSEFGVTAASIVPLVISVMAGADGAEGAVAATEIAADGADGAEVHWVLRATTVQV